MLKNKKIIITLLCLNAILTVILIYSSFQTKPAESKIQPAPEPLSEISNDMMIAILRDYISLAIRGRYHVSSTFGVSVEPHMIEILDLQRLGKGVAHGFLVQVKVKPHTEANQQIGEDHLTFQISNGYVRLLEFKHVQDLPIANTINNGG